MNSLYDLLGAHPDDDAEAIRKAFRKAVKAHHPDLHPGDPEALSRFRQIVAAHALLRDAKQRASYDRALQLEHQQYQFRLEYQQVRSQLERRRLRSKRTRITVAVAGVGALAGGYGLFSPLSTTAILAVQRYGHAAIIVETSGNPGDAAPAVAAAKADDNTPAATASAKADDNTPTATDTAEADDNTPAATAAVKADGNTPIASATAKADAVGSSTDVAGRPVEPAVAQLIEPASPAGLGERGKDVAKVPDQVARPATDAASTAGGEAVRIAEGEPVLPPLSNDAKFYRERAIAAYRGGDFLGAIGNFDEAIRLNPGDAQSYNFRGNVWDELGMSERALADYDEAIRIDPNNPAVFHDRAVLWRRKGALDKALVDLDRAIRFNFADANIYCDRGFVWYEKGRHDRAIADFNHAIKLDPNFAPAYIKRGVILHRHGEFNAAFAVSAKTVRVDPRIFDVTRHTNLRP